MGYGELEVRLKMQWWCVSVNANQGLAWSWEQSHYCVERFWICYVLRLLVPFPRVSPPHWWSSTNLTTTPSSNRLRRTGLITQASRETLLSFVLTLNPHHAYMGLRFGIVTYIGESGLQSLITICFSDQKWWVKVPHLDSGIFWSNENSHVLKFIETLLQLKGFVSWILGNKTFPFLGIELVSFWICLENNCMSWWEDWRHQKILWEATQTGAFHLRVVCCQCQYELLMKTGCVHWWVDSWLTPWHWQGSLSAVFSWQLVKYDGCVHVYWAIVDCFSC